MADWRVGQRIEIDGKPAIVTFVTHYTDRGYVIENKVTRRPGVAVDWESVERSPDGSPRRLGRMIR